MQYFYLRCSQNKLKYVCWCVCVCVGYGKKLGMLCECVNATHTKLEAKNVAFLSVFTVVSLLSYRLRIKSQQLFLIRKSPALQDDCCLPPSSSLLLPPPPSS